MNSNDPDVYLGIPVDIIGCPVNFRIDDFVYNGIVKSWKTTGDQGGARQYVVEIEGPGTLASNAQLILGHYAGSIFNKVGAAQTDGLNEISGPHNNINNPILIPINSYNGNIKEGNLPNVINIYGFLESLVPGGFGGANITEEGIPTRNVIYALNFLLGRYNSQSGTANAQTGLDSNNMFNPYGALLSRTPQSILNIAQPLDYDIFDLSTYPIVNDQNFSLPPLSSTYVSRTAQCTENTDKNGVYLETGNCTGDLIDHPTTGFDTIQKNLSHAGDFTTDPNLSNRGQSRNIWDFGLIPPDVGVDGLPRQLYYLDISEMPLPPPLLRTQISGDYVTSIDQFVGNVCSNAGFEYFWELLYTTVNNRLRKIIKLRTISRLTQPSNTAVKNYINQINRAGVPVSSLHLGVEYSDASPRTLLIGDKQRRLYQVKNCLVPYRTDNYLYNVAISSFVHYEPEFPYNANEERNKIRNPSSWSTRESAGIYAIRDNDLLKTTRVNELVKDNFNQKDTIYSADGANATKGNYDPTNALVIFNRFLESLVGITLTTTKGQKYESVKTYPCDPPQSFPDGTNIDTHYIDTSARYLTEGVVCPAVPRSGGSTFTNPNPQNAGDPNGTTNNAAPVGTLTDFGNLILSYGYNLLTNLANTIYTNLFPTADELARRNKQAEQNTTQNIVNAIIAARRFHPMMLNVICPYFGSVNCFNDAAAFDVKERIKRPRPVWLDTWTNQMCIVFDVKELPIISLYECLKGTYNGDNFIVTESELRAAGESYESWLAYLSGKLFKPDIVIMLHDCLCSDRKIPGPTDPNKAVDPITDPRTRKGDQVRADNVEDADELGLSLGVPPSNGAQAIEVQLLSDNDWDACRIFGSIFKVDSSWFNLKTGSQPSSADAPVNTKAGLAAKIVGDLEVLHEFFRDIYQKYYGKQFMVRMPNVLTYKDLDYSIIENQFVTLSGGYLLATGDEKLYSNYNISTEGAWEEYGNTIDDTIMIGSNESFVLKEDDGGKILPILGFLADDHFDWEAYAVCLDVQKNADTYEREGGSTKFYFYDLLKRANAYSMARKTKYADFTDANNC
jgi:hypothetical protein